MDSGRCTHSASRRRRRTASPSASGSARAPRARPWSRRGRLLPAGRFFRGATALQGSGAATAAMPPTSPPRARAPALPLASPARVALARHRQAPLEAGGGAARDRRAAGRRYRVLSRRPSGARAPGGRAGGRACDPGGEGRSFPAPTALSPAPDPSRPLPTPPSPDHPPGGHLPGCQGLLRSLPTR